MVPGNADESRLYRRVAGLERPAMPMDSKLTSEQISAIKTWIDEGAHWDAGTDAKAQPVDRAALAALENMEIPPDARNYWAFKLPAQEPLPIVSARLTNPIDRFLEKSRQEKGVKAAPRADRLTLLRRAYLDLIGLPPNPAQTAEFMSDNTPGAWERLIDKLLASPHTLRRAVGPSLAGRRALRRFRRLRARLRSSKRLVVSRLCGPIF